MWFALVVETTATAEVVIVAMHAAKNLWPWHLLANGHSSFKFVHTAAACLNGLSLTIHAFYSQSPKHCEVLTARLDSGSCNSSCEFSSLKGCPDGAPSVCNAGLVYSSIVAATFPASRVVLMACKRSDELANDSN